MGRPSSARITGLDYCQYLLSSQTNYTLKNYAEHLQKISHDLINRYLQEQKLTPRLVWEQSSTDIIQSER